jgi:N-acyl-D-amino-acid deacylase
VTSAIVAATLVLGAVFVPDTSTYEDPRTLAAGIDDVFVHGIRVLADGELTGALPGRGLRREPAA